MNLEEARKLACKVDDKGARNLNEERRLAGYALELADEVERLRQDSDFLSIEETDLTTQLLDAEREVERLRGALNTYADKDNWYEDRTEGDTWYAKGRGWDLARSALDRDGECED